MKKLLVTGGLIALLSGCTAGHSATKKDLATIKGPSSCEIAVSEHCPPTETKSEKNTTLSAYQTFTSLIEDIIKNKEKDCYSLIDPIKENLDGYNIRVKRSLADGEENYLSISLFKEKKRGLFPKEELIKKSLACTEKESITSKTYVDTGYFIEGGAIQTASVVLKIKEGRLVAIPDIYGAKEIENPILFKKELVTPTYRHKIVGFVSKNAKEGYVKK